MHNKVLGEENTKFKRAGTFIRERVLTTFKQKAKIVKMNIFNKRVHTKNGTLIANWQEERVLRDCTGEGRHAYDWFIVLGRAVARSHIPKKTGDLEHPIAHGKAFDDTHERIHGEPRLESYTKESQRYGGTYDPVKDMPKTGLRTQLLEAEVGFRRDPLD